jgi:hypothetical protein
LLLHTNLVIRSMSAISQAFKPWLHVMCRLGADDVA